MLILAAVALVALPALATPPTCDQIQQAMSRGADDPARVAAELRTTRARVNACVNLQRTLAGLSERRDAREERRDRDRTP